MNCIIFVKLYYSNYSGRGFGPVLRQTAKWMTETVT